MPPPTRRRREALELPRSHVEDADRVARDHLPGWQLCDQTLQALRRAFPGHSRPEALAKAAVVNALYGTNVLAILAAAHRVSEVLERADLDRCEADVVERMAEVPGLRRRFVSFASKYAHFFIDGDRFPIFDSYAVEMVALHLGTDTPGGRTPSYQQFCAGFGRLAERLGFDRDRRRLDRYLWIAGIGRALRRNQNAPVNAEVKKYFLANPDAAFLPPR